MTLVRGRYGTPSHHGISPYPSSNLASAVFVLHPGYSDGANRFVTLPATDVGGVHYGTALTICGIIAGNTFNTGFFARSREAEPEISDWDSILVGSSFYFFASTDRLSKYPVVTSFADWRFPRSLPPAWQNYTISDTLSVRPSMGLQAEVQQRDWSCRLTLHEDGCEVAHVVPRAEADWFNRNQMMDYISLDDSPAIDHHRNAILLRADIHYLMDRKAWVPMLKENQFVACSMCKSLSQYLSPQFRSLYQNAALQELRGVSKECMFARVAWAVIPLIRPFLELRWSQGPDTTALINDKGEVVELSGTQMAVRYKSASRSQSRAGASGESPAKRARSDAEPAMASADADGMQNESDDALCGWLSLDSAYQEPSDYDECEAEEETWPLRGRKRRRSSEETLVQENLVVRTTSF